MVGNLTEKPALLTGGCGFVGRHATAALFARDVKDVWIIDDLSTGHAPEKWLDSSWKQSDGGGYSVYASKDRTIHFINDDARSFFHLQALGVHSLKLPFFGYAIHLASIVGGRSLIEGDPMLVATDLSIDSAFFLWLTRNKKNAERVLYASSSAAYPIHLQGDDGAIALQESHIDFGPTLGMPDLTYGWSKLTGEYLARLAHQKYGISIASVRPFSGYGEDQDLSYPTPSVAMRVARGDDPIDVWGSGEQSRDFIHIDDCVDAFFAIMEKVEDGSAANIGTGKPTSFNELICTLLRIEKRDANIRPLSDKPVGVSHRYADTTYLFRTIGWKPKISLEDGLKRVLDGAKKRIAGTELPFTLA